MNKTIVIDEEYSSAAHDYAKIAGKIHDATEHFKKTVNNMIFKKAISGLAAHNMQLYLSEMSTTLKATFKEQVSLEATLCNEYLKKINEADKSMSFNQSTKGVQNMSFWEAPAILYPEGVIMLNKAAIQECIEQLKAGPVKDVQDYLGQVKHISFDESAGAVKEQNIVVRDKTAESLQALFKILSTFITALESIMATMQNTDESIAQKIQLFGMENKAPWLQINN